MSTRSADVHRQKRWVKRAERRRDHVDRFKHTKPADLVLAEKLAQLSTRFNEDADK